MEFPIIYEDDYLCVIDKPAGIVVNRAESVKEETVQDWAEKKFRLKADHPLDEKLTEENKDFFERSGIVHRIDKDTSGLLLIAKQLASFKALQLLFAQREMHKEYIALVHGKIEPGKGDIHASVGRLPWNRQRFGVLAGGREAHTSYLVMQYYIDKSPALYSLVQLLPTTGRTHQIRIHMKYIGHPLVSDKFYAGRKTYKRDRLFCPRLFLHAGRLHFLHPITAKEIDITSQLPDDLNTVLNQLAVID